MKLSPLFLAAALAATPALAQEAPPSPTPPPPPKLVIVIAVDQFSGDIFTQYREHFTGGFKRLMQGAVFPMGYQSHAATETCPGHSTITTGVRPARTGVIANEWIDLKAGREDKTLNCSEDGAATSTSNKYTVSPVKLMVPTLGERMKAANPATRVVAVGGKDRSATMMGGHNVDEIWWFDDKGYRSYVGRQMPAAVATANAKVAATLAQAQPALPIPAACASRDRPVAVGGGKNVSVVHFARDANDLRAFRTSPEYDRATLGMAAGLIRDMKLGTGSTTDIISVGASGTDAIGHTYGPGGVEMCLNLLTLDQELDAFFKAVDATGVDYAVALTADHGGLDLPERSSENGAPAQRAAPDLNAKTIGNAVAKKLGLKGQLVYGRNFGDMWIDPKLTKAQHAKVQAEAIKLFRAAQQVHSVYTRAEILATPMPNTPPDTWSMLQRARASYYPDRSGDFVVALKPRVTPIVDPMGNYVATHGSFWDYDRRVPILFWRNGMTGFEQPMSIETVDIAPTLAGLIGLKLNPGDMDGRCLDLQVGPASTCGAATK